ncbi:hypothetical protein Ancab_037425 [Ancistrocladus abbreviatus]
MVAEECLPTISGADVKSSPANLGGEGLANGTAPGDRVRGKMILTYKRRKCGTGTLSSENRSAQSEDLSSAPAPHLLQDKMVKELVGTGLEKNSYEQLCDPKINCHSVLNDADNQSYQHWRNALEYLCQALNTDEGGAGGIQGCIRDALVNDPQSDAANISEKLAHLQETADHHEDRAHACRSSVFKGSVSVAEEPAVVTSNRSSSESVHLNITRQCQKAFSRIIMSQKFASLCKLLSENFHGFKVDKILDFSLINTRMKERAYEQKPTLFPNDIQQFWRKLHIIGNEMVSLANSLSELSRLFCRELAVGLEDGTSDYRKHEVNELFAWHSDWRGRLEQVDASVYTAGTCRHCGEKSDGRDCLVCDSCEEMFHVSCIKPAVKEIPHKNWYCTNCSEIGVELLHEDCVVCERLNASIGTDEDGFDTVHRDDESLDEFEESSGCMLEDGLQVFAGNQKASCMVCKNSLEIGEVFRVCGHRFCHRYYHFRCLTNKQLRSYGPRWYGPCCLCRVCLTDKDDDKVVLCDACDHAYHVYCMNPPRSTIPSGRWFCKKCAAGIVAIHEAKKVYQNLGESRRKKGEERKRVCARSRKKSRQDVKMTVDRSGGMDMLLTAANTITYQEELAALYTKS